MKKIILLISVLLFSFSCFSQEKTIISINVEELKEKSVIYEIYVVVDLYDESCVYCYIIDNNKINDIVYLTDDPWIQFPIEKEFASNTIEIWYVSKFKDGSYFEGEFKDIIDLCYKNKFEFKKTSRSIYYIKYRDFNLIKK